MKINPRFLLPLLLCLFPISISVLSALDPADDFDRDLARWRDGERGEVEKRLAAAFLYGYGTRIRTASGIRLLESSGADVKIRPLTREPYFLLPEDFSSDNALFDYVCRGRELHSAAALRIAGFLALTGRGTKKDPARALDFYRAAAEMGDPAAMDFLLGLPSYPGAGDLRNKRAAVLVQRKKLPAGFHVFAPRILLPGEKTKIKTVLEFPESMSARGLLSEILKQWRAGEHEIAIRLPERPESPAFSPRG